MDADCAVVRRGQDQDLERQRQAAFQDVARSAQRPACAEPPHVLCMSRASRTRLPLAAWHCMGVRVGLPAFERIGPVAQWLEPTAHNGLVGGSNPPGPTIFNDFNVRIRFERSGMLVFSSRISLVNRWSNWEAPLVRGGGSQVQILPLRLALSIS